MSKTTVQLITACVLVALGIWLLVVGFCVPPMGIIHGSVLTAFGEVCTFAGALFGVDYHYKFKMNHKE